MPRSHRDQMKKHAIYRMYERYGIVLSFPEYNRICEALKARNDHVAVGYGGRVFFEIAYRHIKTIACFDTVHGVIVTFVPRVPLATATVRAA